MYSERSPLKMPGKRCHSWPLCDRYVSADASPDEQWCDEHRAIFDRIYNEIHPKKKRGEKNGWTSATLLPTSSPKKRTGSRVEIEGTILNTLAKGSLSGTELAAAVKVDKADSTYLRARAALAKDGKIVRNGKTWSLAAEQRAAA
jgi:hypothetical protein